MLITAESDFWNKVITDKCPEIDGTGAAKEFLDKNYKGGDKDAVVLPEEAAEYIKMYISSSAEEDNAKAKKQEASNRIKALMKNHNKAICGEHTVLWTPVTTERFDSKSFKAADPDTYEKYIKSSTSRRFTVK